MDTAIVELDALPDAVRPAAQDDDLLLVRRAGLILGDRGGPDMFLGRNLVGRIQIRRLRLEFGRAGVDPLEHGANAVRQAGLPDLFLGDARQLHQTAVGKPHPLASFQFVAISKPGGAVAPCRFVLVDDLAQIAQEPGIDLRQRESLGVGESLAHRLGELPEAVGPRAHDASLQLVQFGRVVEIQSPTSDLQRTQRLAQRLLERPPDGHDLADRFHLRAELGVRPGNFSNAKRGTLVTT